MMIIIHNDKIIISNNNRRNDYDKHNNNGDDNVTWVNLQYSTLLASVHNGAKKTLLYNTECRCLKLYEKGWKGF